MESPAFEIIEHTLPAQYIREYHCGLTSDASRPKLAIKEYRPLSGPISENALTVIATHANGISKETYEALWEDLSNLWPGQLRAIWFADCVHQGASASLNDEILSDDPHWFDHSRDLLALINHFADKMPRPLVGVGHSMGCAQLVQLALIHPRLLDSLVLIEPVIRQTPPPGPNAALPSSYRPDRWSSRQDAEASFRRNRFFQTWDPRCLNAFLRHGLRVMSQAPDDRHGAPAAAGQVTLTTSKAQEAWSYVRPNFAPVADDGLQRAVSERRRTPDIPKENRRYQFDRAEMMQAYASLPNVRPRTLWVFADRSFINSPAENADMLQRTGTGIGGSGGAEEGAVEAITITGSSHMLPLEKPTECAKILRSWLAKTLHNFVEVEEWWAKYDSGKSTKGMALSQEWMKRVKQKEHTIRDEFKGKL